MHRILPFSARLRGRLRGNRLIRDCASEEIELAPPLEREHPAAISLPSEFDRVLTVQEQTTLEMELGRLRPGMRQHGPTTAYRLDHAVLAQGSLYFEGGYDVIRGGSNAFLPRRQDRFEEMQLCTNHVIDHYFGHWLIEGLALELMARQMALPALVLSGEPWCHEPDYRKLTGLTSAETANALIDRLWVVDDRGINEGWISRVKELRRRIQSAASQAGKKRVFFTRGTTGAIRNLVNSMEVHAALETAGFDIIDPEKETAASLVNALSSAEIALLVEGSAQNHCIYGLPFGSTLVTIQPPTRFNANSKDRADAVGLNWAFVVADPHVDGFHLPIERLMKTLDRVSQVTAQRGLA